MKTVLFALVVFALLVSCQPPASCQSWETPSWMQASSDGKPIIRLDKSRFASGENVFFWVGVQAVNHGSIPKEDWNTCRLTITRPDGVRKTHPIGWPADGMVDKGWEGGMGLFEKPQPGVYHLQFEFAGQKTQPVSLTVEDLPILKKIQAGFVFGSAQANGEVPVTFVVKNGSSETIRFSHRDGFNGMVWVSLTKKDKSYSSNSFYPANGLLDQDEPQLPNQGYTNFTWDMAQKVPTVVIAPGMTYRQKLSMNDAFSEANHNLPLTPGQYQVTFGTNLQVLVGEADGALAAFSPVHIAVTDSTVHTLNP